MASLSRKEKGQVVMSGTYSRFRKLVWPPDGEVACCGIRQNQARAVACPAHEQRVVLAISLRLLMQRHEQPACRAIVEIHACWRRRYLAWHDRWLDSYSEHAAIRTPCQDNTIARFSDELRIRPRR